MNTIVSTGITIGSVDYLERDKIITVLMLSGEKVSLRARGINAPKAKLKFAGELFSLCEFEHTQNKNALLISATPKHMFWGVRESVEKLYLACFALENIMGTQEDGKFLLACLSFLEVNEYSGSLAVKYIFETLKHLGVGFSASACISCGGKISNNFSFDFDRGGFVCEDCGGSEKSSALKTFQLMEEMDMQALSKMHFKKEQIMGMLEILRAHANAKLGKQSENLNQIIKLQELTI